MTAIAWPLIIAAVVAAWPVSGGLRRLGPRPARGPVRVPDPRELALRSPRRFAAAGGLVAAVPAGLAGGPVAALIGGVYATLGAHEFAGWAARGRTARRRTADLDGLTAIATDLRAGALPGPAAAPVGGRLGELAGATERLARQTGAPVADLVERIEADARAADRARASAAAEAAGAQTTALLLAILPVAGIALGYGIGADPLDIMLHTPLGAACAIAAALLQGIGLLWANRLARGPRP
ncbi:hypothetical protein [Actinoplanes sp. NPDC051494]|uniref:hypothetical protein n=1 Tax=Actinoplanes sp. NPDC051494 TaxID=3363907 RepID=UPI0037B6065C